MPPSSRDPGDNESLRRLTGALDNLIGEFAADVEDAKKLETRTRATTEAAETRLAKEESLERRKRVAGRTGDVEKVTAEAAADARERDFRASQGITQAQRTNAEQLRRSVQQAERLASATERARDAQAEAYLQRAGLRPAPTAPTPGPALAAADAVRQASEAEAQARRRAAATAGPPAGGGRGSLTEALGGERLPPVLGEAAGLDERAQALQRAREQADALAGSEARLSTQFAQSAITADLASQRYRKHGALTTEFIEAAAKGQVTLRELGYQVTSTVGKFAGWTAAASAVFGAAAAMRELGKGALDAESGVGLVSRVVTEQFDADRLKQGFRDLASGFNVPIDEVSQAVFGAGKVFNDLPSALKASESSLFAMKVGELDAAQATESLTAIVNGFKLSANELPEVFDAINNAQNTLGGNVGQLTRGVARAGGQFRASGGDYRELIAILTAGARLTGATAEEVATAVGRSASVVRTPAGAARARAAGLDPTQDPLSLLQQAQELAQGASPERVQELARAIIPAGGQFARIFVPLIQNKALLDRALQETSAEEAQGSAQRELAKALAQPNEQIKALAVNLQVLGSALAETGALTPLILGLKSLNLLLKGTKEVFEFIGETIPDPLKPILATALELYAVLRLLQRFDVGGQLAPGSRLEPLRAALSTTPERRQRRQITQGLEAQQRFLADARERAGQRAALDAFRQRQAERRLVQAGDSGDEKLLLRRQSELERATDRASASIAEEADLRRAITEADEQRAVFLRETKQGADASTAAVRAGIPLAAPGDLGRPTTAGAVPVAGGGPARGPAAGGQTPGGVFLPSGVEVDPATATREARATNERLGRLRTRMEPFAGQLRNLQRRLAALGVSGRVIGAAAGATANVITGSSRGLVGAARGMAGLAGSLLRMLGPLDALIIAAVVVPEIIANQNQQMEDLDKALAVGDPEKLRKHAEAERKKIEDRGLLGDVWQGFKEEIDQLFTDPGAFLFEPEDGLDTERKQLIAKRLREAAALKARQDVGEGLFLPQISGRLRSALESATGRQEEIEAFEEAIKEVDQGFAQSEGDEEAKRKAREAKQRYIRAIAALKAAGGDIFDALAAIGDAEGLEGLINSQEAEIALRGLRGNDPRFQAEAVFRARQLLAQNRITAEEAVARIQQAQDLLNDALEEIETAIDQARNPAEARRLRSRLLRIAARGNYRDPQGRIDDLTVSRRIRRARIADLEAEIERLDEDARRQQNPLGAPDLGGLPRGPQSRRERKLRSDLDILRRRNRQDLETQRELGDQQRQNRRDLRELTIELQRAQFELDTSVFDARTDLFQSRTADSRAGARILVDRLRKGYDRVRRAYRRGLATIEDVLGAEAELNRGVQALAQEDVENFQGRQELATARFEAGGASEGQMLRRAVSDAEQFAAYVKGKGDKLDPDAYRQAMVAVFNARTALNNFVKEEAESLLEARAELAKSRTDDPLVHARIDERLARDKLRGADTPEERIRAMADLNNRRRDKHQLVSERRLDEIDLDADIGRITVDQQIKAYEQVLRTTKAGVEFKRQLRMRIKRLKAQLDREDNAFELNVGDVRIPSTYEIRRAMGLGREGRAFSQQQTNHITLTVTSPDAVDPVMSRVERITGTRLKAKARAAGMR